MHKMKGALGLLDHESQNQALRLRFIHKILDQNVEKKWTYFARYWISVKLSNICNEWASLHRRDRPMNTRDNLVPEHYKQILTLTTQHLQNILKDKHKTTKTTYTLIREHKEKNTQIAQETIWYDMIRRLNGNTLHWKKLWKHT